ncbi:CHAP domain-containing protein [Entomobacter blattae]|uniref:Peptidase C51 domain-containing protein n=1 Tax=Entomobacter blattae TaxID=2762277 RepID=A0A7H1NUR0_9PROT|nr:CHAP domain-containing protein [Entomobacter blattae]QNT79520.1 hypothetical protein JGUZn3_23190 [Entomobacter blattae]
MSKRLSFLFPFCVSLFLFLAGCASSSEEGEYTALQCAPYARSLTGVNLRGSAASWWRQSVGVYPHTKHPRAGAVLVFRSTRRIPDGHVAVVTSVENSRKVLVDHANWEPHRVDHGVPVVDISRTNDWSRVKVWWAPINHMGSSAYPTYGFILPDLTVADAGS